MKLPTGLKIAGFAALCLIWLLAGLTLLGPLFGEIFPATVGNIPPQPFDSMTCPERLPAGQTAEIVARFTNHSGKTQSYDVSFTVGVSGETVTPSGAVCQPTAPLADGETGQAMCSVGPLPQAARVQVTAWAEGEDFLGTCDTGCANSFSGACTILPDVWTMLTRPDSLLINGIILSLGLGLVALGASLWRGAGWTARIVMVGFFTASALMLALAVYEVFGHWLAPALVIGPLPEAILIAALWLRGHPAPSIQ